MFASSVSVQHSVRSLRVFMVSEALPPATSQKKRWSNATLEISQKSQGQSPAWSTSATFLLPPVNQFEIQELSPELLLLFLLWSGTSSLR